MVGRKFGGVGARIGNWLNSLLVCPLCLCPHVSWIMWAIVWNAGLVDLSIITFVLHSLASGAIGWTIYRYAK